MTTETTGLTTLPDEWIRVDAALDELLALPPHEWPQAIERLSEGDAAMADELRGLVETMQARQAERAEQLRREAELDGFPLTRAGESLRLSPAVVAAQAAVHAGGRELTAEAAGWPGRAQDEDEGPVARGDDVTTVYPRRRRLLERLGGAVVALALLAGAIALMAWLAGARHR